MKTKFEKVISEDLNLPTEIKTQLQEAWDEQLSEAKEQALAEMREEFAQKFEHDKSVLLSSINQFLEEKLRAELTEFAEDKKQLTQEKVEYKKKLKTFESFLVSNLAKEIKELREDRVKATESLNRMEGFVIQQLAEEIKSLHEDKKALVEQKVKMVKRGKTALVEAKQEFITKAAALVESNIDALLRKEITQYRNDIEAARKNDFGRRIFEAFGAEFMTSHLNESSEVKKLQRVLESQVQENKKLKDAIAEKDTLVESAKSKLNAANDRLKRDRIMSKLLSPLGREKQGIMKDLLESVQTDKLEATFNKYLPAVLNETIVEKASKGVLNEGRVEKTGARVQPNTPQSEESRELAEIIKLAGIK